MDIGYIITLNGEFYDASSSKKSNRTQREHKGKSLIAFPSDFCVVDLETTGFSPQYNEIIEFAALRIRNGRVIDSLSSLVKPRKKVSTDISELCGITNDMLSSAPAPGDFFPIARSFIGSDVIVGHNVGFDINFLYDNFAAIAEAPLSNNYINTARIARKLFPDLQNYRLKSVAKAVGFSQNKFHRALDDCQTAFECFTAMRDRISQSVGIDSFLSGFFKNGAAHAKLNLHTITTDNTVFDETHPLFGKRCVFTGTLDRMTRAEAAQLVVNVGGICDNNVTKKTNFLILGNNDYCKSITDGKSSKQKKAEEYKQNGLDIEVIPEDVFYDMLGE